MNNDGIYIVEDLQTSYIPRFGGNRFNLNKNIPVFLISLKAGGVGLNLTGANMVIHYDPWWNPAIESQATDRAHRIGQKNVVTSIKLLVSESVEEKVFEFPS